MTPANADALAEVGRLTQAVQAATGNSVAVGYVDQGYTGERPAEAARTHGMVLEVIKLSEAKRGFVLLSRRWVVERAFAWAARFRRFARNYERLPTPSPACIWSLSQHSCSPNLPPCSTQSVTPSQAWDTRSYA